MILNSFNLSSDLNFRVYSRTSIEYILSVLRLWVGLNRTTEIMIVYFWT